MAARAARLARVCTRGLLGWNIPRSPTRKIIHSKESLLMRKPCPFRNPTLAIQGGKDRYKLVENALALTVAAVSALVLSQERVSAEDELPREITKEDIAAWIRELPDEEDEDILRQQFDEWMKECNREYLSEAAKEYRYHIFKSRSSYLELCSKITDDTVRRQMRKLADLTDGEFFFINYVPPESVDWRALGAVTGVRNQLACGSCWAIPPVEATEALHWILHGELVQFSVQQVLDCECHRTGCKGGHFYFAFNYIEQNGLTREQDYPFNKYFSADDVRVTECQSYGKPVIARIGGCQIVPPSDEFLMKAVAINPVAITIFVDSSFKDYDGGLMTIEEYPPPDSDEDIGEGKKFEPHGVLAVAYGTDDYGRKFWLCKNNHGEAFGNKGYLYLERGVSDSRGVCGMHMTPGEFPIPPYDLQYPIELTMEHRLQTYLQHQEGKSDPTLSESNDLQKNLVQKPKEVLADQKVNATD